MDSVQINGSRARFVARSLKREEAARSFDRLEPGLAGQVAAELAASLEDRTSFQALCAILKESRTADSFRPHAPALARATSLRGPHQDLAKYYRSLLQRFPETATPELLVQQVLPNPGGVWVALEQLEHHPEWAGAIADGVLAQADPSADAWQALSRTANPTHRDALAARVLQPGPLDASFFYGVAGLGQAGLEGLRPAVLQKLLHAGEPVRRYHAPDTMAFPGCREAYAALVDPATAGQLLDRLEAAGPFEKLKAPEQAALAVLGSCELAPEHEARLEALCRGEMESNHGWSALDNVVDVYRKRHQSAQLRGVREAGGVPEKVACAREYLRTVVHRVIPSSLEFQTRDICELLAAQLDDAQRQEVGRQLVEEFVQAGPRPSRAAQGAIYLAHRLEAPGVQEAIEPFLSHPPAGPLEQLVSAARSQRVADLTARLLSAPLDAAGGLAEQLLAFRPEDEVYETWNQAVPEHHWVARYSEDPKVRFQACYCEDPALLQELHGRLGEHPAALKAYHQVRGLVEQGVPLEQARERALLGYLVPGAARSAHQLALTPEGVQVGGVRLRRKS